MPGIRVLGAVGWVTFLEILRDKVLYNTLVISALLFGLGVLVSKTSFIRPDRVVLDFGITAIAISNGMLAILLGSSMLAREFDRRTIHLALTRPLTKFQFLFGKFSGLAGILLLNGILLAIGHHLVLWVLDAPASVFGFQSTLTQGLLLLAMQSVVLAALAVFFSTFSTPALSTMMAIGIYLIGVNSSQLAMLATKMEQGWSRSLLSVLASVLPNFEHFNLGLKITYGIAVAPKYVFFSLGYGVVWVLLLIAAGGMLVERRET